MPEPMACSWCKISIRHHGLSRSPRPARPTWAGFLLPAPLNIGDWGPLLASLWPSDFFQPFLVRSGNECSLCNLSSRGVVLSSGERQWIAPIYAKARATRPGRRSRYSAPSAHPSRICFSRSWIRSTASSTACSNASAARFVPVIDSVGEDFARARSSRRCANNRGPPRAIANATRCQHF